MSATSTVRTVESVAIVGAGFMGSGIAESVAVAGLPVSLLDVNEVAVGRAHERIEASLARAVKGGKLDAEQAQAAAHRIALSTDLDRIDDADLVVEAVPEDEQLKTEVMRAIDGIADEHSIVASNTSSIPI